MQIIKKSDKAASYIYLVAVLIHLAIMCGEYGTWEIPFRGRLLQVAFGLCVVKIIMTYYSYLEWALMAGMAVLSILSYAFTREKYVVYVTVLIFAAKSVDIKVINKIILDVVVISMILVAIMSLAGQGGMVADVRDYGRGAVETRYCLGFSHANNLHGTLWYATSLVLLLYYEQMTWKSYLILMVMNIIMYILTASKAGVVVTTIVILAGVLYRYADKYVFQKAYPYILGLLGYAGIIALTLVSVTVDFFKGYGPILKKLDSITTGRINLAYHSAYIGDWKLLSDGGNHKYTVDNGFASLAADFGIIVWAVYLAFVLSLFIVSWKKKNGVLLALVFSCAAYTFMEKSYVLNDAYLLANLSFIVAMYLLANKKKPELKETID